MRKLYSLLCAAAGAVLVAGSGYIVEANGCWIPYKYQWNEWPPSYGFWCVKFESVLSIAIIIGILLFVGGLIASIFWLIRKT